LVLVYWASFILTSFPFFTNSSVFSLYTAPT
jgi:hypothetical protein